MRRSMDCVICGKYAQYVALSDGTCLFIEPRGESRIRSSVVKVVDGDPVCLGHTIRSMKNPNQFVRYAQVEKLEPGRVLIDGLEARA